MITLLGTFYRTTVNIKDGKATYRFRGSVKPEKEIRRLEFRSNDFLEKSDDEAKQAQSVVASMMVCAGRLLWSAAHGRPACSNLKSGCGGLGWLVTAGPLGGMLVRECPNCKQRHDQFSSYWKDVRIQVTKEHFQMIPMEFRKFFVKAES